MAQRRMFSPKIIGSDAFLDMPTSTRELYFQLGMYADDDGFINPKKIIRMIGASEDDLKILIGKRFVLPFESGVVVIKHWAINNLIRKDWRRPTLYKQELESLKLKENGAYTELVNEKSPDRQRSVVKSSIVKLNKATNSYPAEPGEDEEKSEDISTTETQLNPVTDDESKEVIPTTRPPSPPIKQEDAVNLVISVFHDTVNPDVSYVNAGNRNSARELVTEHGLDETLRAARFATSPEVVADKYAPQISTPYQLKEKYAALKTYALRLKTRSTGRVIPTKKL